jgi:hypothetical protein
VGQLSLEAADSYLSSKRTLQFYSFYVFVVVEAFVKLYFLLKLMPMCFLL